MKRRSSSISKSDIIEIANAAKTLFANIRFASPDNPVHLVALTSSIPNEGKTTVSIELAKTMASSGRKTLIVEVDMHRRSLAGTLDVHPKYGYYAVLAGECSLDQAIASTGIDNLHFLDVEPSIPNPAGIIASNRFAQLVRDLRDRYEYVVFDTPPVGVFVDAAILSTLVDGTIFVIRRKTVKREEMLRAYSQLKAAGGNILGSAFTFTEMKKSGYYSSRYYSESNQISDPDNRAFVDDLENVNPMPKKRTANAQMRSSNQNASMRLVDDPSLKKRGRHHA